MITNDQMIMQTLDNISNLNNQIQIHNNADQIQELKNG